MSVTRNTVEPYLCDCGQSPIGPERCSPLRGGFNCGGEYRMPKLPPGMVCATRLRLLKHVLLASPVLSQTLSTAYGAPPPVYGRMNWADESPRPQGTGEMPGCTYPYCHCDPGDSGNPAPGGCRATVAPDMTLANGNRGPCLWPDCRGQCGEGPGARPCGDTAEVLRKVGKSAALAAPYGKQRRSAAPLTLTARLAACATMIYRDQPPLPRRFAPTDELVADVKRMMAREERRTAWMVMSWSQRLRYVLRKVF